MNRQIMFRLEDGQLAERWATVTGPAALPKGASDGEVQNVGAAMW